MTKTDLINRNAFLKQLGFSSAALLATACLGSCSKADTTVAPLASDIVLDLTATSNAALKTNGGYVVLTSQNVVVARTNTGAYAAVTLICSHEGERKITYRTSEFYCTEHGARYDNNGVGLNSEGSKGIKSYTTVLSGTTLTIKAS
ncbi:Rieske 2Fe-2S domain-containing protein [Fibrella forsythiae]|uniref:Rieske 2Fe-2S domain-containing protein n=1 Tax=Fibrella forsythiae TaxID=2817061 RepID=A0ABS3JNV3_9BACT|nr:Rieske 2Fe-2S domain-containing protein [Fibrella forsythiae]MBO0951685.1 Rieske 2Fe-2S domain-containing protein [Fibrella forsythiae]